MASVMVDEIRWALINLCNLAKYANIYDCVIDEMMR